MANFLTNPVTVIMFLGLACVIFNFTIRIVTDGQGIFVNRRYKSLYNTLDARLNSDYDHAELLDKLKSVNSHHEIYGSSEDFHEIYILHSMCYKIGEEPTHKNLIKVLTDICTMKNSNDHNLINQYEDIYLRPHKSGFDFDFGERLLSFNLLIVMVLKQLGVSPSWMQDYLYNLIILTAFTVLSVKVFKILESIKNKSFDDDKFKSSTATTGIWIFILLLGTLQ